MNSPFQSPTLAALVLLAIMSASSLSSCGLRTRPGSTPSPSPSASSSPSSNPVSSPSPGSSPTATPSAPASKYRYDLPLSVKAVPECGEAEQLLYQVQPGGRFRFYPGEYNPFGEGDPPAMQTRDLSESEQKVLEVIIAEADLAARFEASKPVPDDAPMTLECRTVRQLTLDVDGSPRTFDANGRKYEHTQAYRDAIGRIEQQLKLFAAGSSAGQGSHYGLALKLYNYLECDMSQVVAFEISASGVLKYLKPGTEASPEYALRELGRLEIKEITDLLTQLDLYTQYKAQPVIPEGSPQTEECRAIERVDLEADGMAQTIDGRRSRKIEPSAAYLAAVAQLRTKLTELSQR